MRALRLVYPFKRRKKAYATVTKDGRETYFTPRLSTYTRGTIQFRTKTRVTIKWDQPNPKRRPVRCHGKHITHARVLGDYLLIDSGSYRQDDNIHIEKENPLGWGKRDAEVSSVLFLTARGRGIFNPMYTSKEEKNILSLERKEVIAFLIYGKNPSSPTATTTQQASFTANYF